MSAESADIYDRLRDVEDNSLRNALGLTAHEKECAIRYGHINESVTRVRQDFRQAAFYGIGLMLTVLGFLIKLVFFPA